MQITPQQLRQALGETAEINKRGQDALLTKLDQIETKKDEGRQRHKEDRKTSQNAILSQIKGVENAVTNKKDTDEVSIKNYKEANSEIVAGLFGVIDTIKEEVAKLDSETIINNDFTRLEELFKDNKDKDEVIMALEAVEDAINSIESPESTDYTQVLNSIKDKIETPDNKDIVEALEALLLKEFRLPDVFPVDLDPNLIEDKRVRVTLPKSQVAAMGKVVQDSGSNSAKIIAAIEASGGLQRATDMEGLGDIEVGSTEVEIVITGTPEDIRIRADRNNTGEIFIGKTGVLADGSNDFIRLESGDEFTMKYDDRTNAIYAISDTASQKINVGILL